MRFVLTAVAFVCRKRRPISLDKGDRARLVRIRLSIDIASVLPSGRSAWFAVSRGSDEKPTYYAITVVSFELSEGPTSVKATLEFTSEDSVDDIMKVVRTSEVWNQKPHFILIPMISCLSDEFVQLKLFHSSVISVSKRANTGIRVWELTYESAGLS